MVEPADGPSAERLEELVVAALDRLEEGGEAALDALLDDHPREAEEVRNRLETLREMGLIEGAPGGVPERLGEFRLVEQLGAGGMGVVYRAVQEPLGREVALKIIRPEQLYFRGARERFQREVETIARLQHPGIVAVHAVGEADGVPYFAMELVRGKGLDEILAGLAGRDPARLTGRDLDPAGAGVGYLFEGSWETACLRLVRQVCEALEFAHANGILHRDIKPSNVMITTEGATRALLLDFGLATGGDTSRLTKTGSQVGSLRYMASEQLRGDSARVGPTTDVYGLGVTLYELLSNGPAFSGHSDVELILAIERGELPHLRARSPAASWEAETICATATDPDPARRYASAADFGRDLANALERRPLEARRPGALLRARRWVQRRPAAATAAVLGALLVVGGPATYAWQQRRASRAMAEQLARTERVADLTLESMDRMLSRLGGEDLKLVPQVEPVRRAALEDAVELAERLVAERGDDPRARLGAAQAYSRLGRLLTELGRHSEAAPANARAAERFAALAADRPDDEELATLVVTHRLGHARNLSALGDAARALELLEELGGELDAAAAPADGTRARLRASVRTARGVLLKDLDRHADAREALSKSAAALGTMAEDDPEDPVLAQAANEAWNEYALLLSTRYSSDEEGVDPETLPAMERALELAERLTELEPDEVRHRLRVASSRGNLGGVYRRMARYDEAQECYAAARDALEDLVRDFPSTLLYKLELATVRNQLGFLVDVRSRSATSREEFVARYALAEPHFVATIELLEEVAAAVPEVFQYRHRLAVARYNLAALVDAIHADPTRFAALAQASLADALRARRLAPTNGDVTRTVYDARRMVAGALLALGKHVEALEHVEALPEIFPDAWSSWTNATTLYARAVAVVRGSPELDPLARQQLVEDYAERACELARVAIERGVPNPETIGQLQDLTPLRGTTAFDALVDEIAGG